MRSSHAEIEVAQIKMDVGEMKEITVTIQLRDDVYDILIRNCQKNGHEVADVLKSSLIGSLEAYFARQHLPVKAFDKDA